jgi:hypothetical protein
MNNLSRRKFLFCAPSIVRADSLMKIWVPETEVIDDIYPLIIAPGHVNMVHHALADDLRNMVGFVSIKEYEHEVKGRLVPGEVGALHGQRFATSGKFLVDSIGNYHEVRRAN